MKDPLELDEKCTGMFNLLIEIITYVVSHVVVDHIHFKIIDR